MRNYDNLADWTVFLHGKLPTCGFFLLDANTMGNHLVRDPPQAPPRASLALLSPYSLPIDLAPHPPNPNPTRSPPFPIPIR